jgi:hypothetical protein
VELVIIDSGVGMSIDKSIRNFDITSFLSRFTSI